MTSQPHIIDILTALVDEQGAIVSSNSCSPMELAFARKEGRFYTDESGFGYVLRMRAWREFAEAEVSRRVVLENASAARRAEERDEAIALLAEERSTCDCGGEFCWDCRVNAFLTRTDTKGKP